MCTIRKRKKKGCFPELSVPEHVDGGGEDDDHYGEVLFMLYDATVRGFVKIIFLVDSARGGNFVCLHFMAIRGITVFAISKSPSEAQIFLEALEKGLVLKTEDVEDVPELKVGSFARGLFLVHSECLESNYIVLRMLRGLTHLITAVWSDTYRSVFRIGVICSHECESHRNILGEYLDHPLLRLPVSSLLVQHVALEILVAHTHGFKGSKEIGWTHAHDHGARESNEIWNNLHSKHAKESKALFAPRSKQDFYNNSDYSLHKQEEGPVQLARMTLKRNCPQYLAELLKKKGNKKERSLWRLCGGIRVQRASRKLKPGALSLYVGNGQREAVEAIGNFSFLSPGSTRTRRPPRPHVVYDIDAEEHELLDLLLFKKKTPTWMELYTPIKLVLWRRAILKTPGNDYSETISPEAEH
ncbi:retrotransposon protein, putative, ty1-copia subclass [Tanacetum coccineum]